MPCPGHVCTQPQYCKPSLLGLQPNQLLHSRVVSELLQNPHTQPLSTLISPLTHFRGHDERKTRYKKAAFHSSKQKPRPRSLSLVSFDALFPGKTRKVLPSPSPTAAHHRGSPPVRGLAQSPLVSLLSAAPMENLSRGRRTRRVAGGSTCGSGCPSTSTRKRTPTKRPSSSPSPRARRAAACARAARAVRAAARARAAQAP